LLASKIGFLTEYHSTKSDIFSTNMHSSSV
jgi:hypothetical protein